MIRKVLYADDASTLNSTISPIFTEFKDSIRQIIRIVNRVWHCYCILEHYVKEIYIYSSKRFDVNKYNLQQDQIYITKISDLTVNTL